MARPRIYDDPADFDAAVDAYVAECKAEGDPMTVAGLALALGFCHPSSVSDYGKRPEFSASVKRARAFLQHSTEQWAIKHKSAGAIFSLKHNFAWRDKQEVEMTGPGGGPMVQEIVRRIVDPADADGD